MHHYILFADEAQFTSDAINNARNPNFGHMKIREELFL
jgi:hypothetical protein